MYLLYASTFLQLDHSQWRWWDDCGRGSSAVSLVRNLNIICSCVISQCFLFWRFYIPNFIGNIVAAFVLIVSMCVIQRRVSYILSIYCIEGGVICKTTRNVFIALPKPLEIYTFILLWYTAPKKQRNAWCVTWVSGGTVTKTVVYFNNSADMSVSRLLYFHGIETVERWCASTVLAALADNSCLVGAPL